MGISDLPLASGLRHAKVFQKLGWVVRRNSSHIVLTILPADVRLLMRTTLNMDDDALLAIKKYACHRRISLGQAASDLVHRGVESLPQFKMKNGWVVFELPTGTPPLTNETLDAWEKAEGYEEHRRAFSPRR